MKRGKAESATSPTHFTQGAPSCSSTWLKWELENEHLAEVNFCYNQNSDKQNDAQIHKHAEMLKISLPPPQAWRHSIHKKSKKKRWRCVPSKVHRKTFMLKSVSFLYSEFTGREEIAAKSILADVYLYTYLCPFWAVFYTEIPSH